MPASSLPFVLEAFINRLFTVMDINVIHLPVQNLECGAFL